MAVSAETDISGADAGRREWIRRVLGLDLSRKPAPRSVLPEPPAVLTPQGRTLAAAAARGAFLCASCEPRKAAHVG